MHLRDLTQFLTELSENNTRPWFLWNKPRYDILRTEFEETVTELIKALTKFDKQVAACNPKKAMFRIHRDTRFSKDKTPYKTRFSAGITPHDKRRPSAGGGSTYYFHIERDGTLGFGVGEYLPPAPRLKAIREHVVNDATGFAKVLKNKHLRATYNDMLEEDKLQRPPKGFDPDHPHVDYLKLKSFFVWTEVKLDLNAPDQLVPRLAQGFQDAYALVSWLRSVPEPQEEATNE
ncbi:MULTISPECIES: DUF2461 domain-containing protein [Massilia]|uniref:TIGR02453 family protein n=2 Tax=Massilia TaxID=149698 RepID=A0A422QM21_9BURK|nr:MULTISPECIES: DUF2461 domain-containing protein [Massilia]MDY0963456.1 DUF2461 domain-containing protein [Massilia sp. CFBP9026]MDY0974469.1 DUF2461 domain-containing protein [Massilia sp. CFBP9012]RNF31037.1 hypothetical protein NM04_09285 [Massilia aurea]TXF99384.1 DUF2461 domain-containing protein [Massilia arenae]